MACSFSTTTVTSATTTDDDDSVQVKAKQKMTTIRLYRMLQRQIRGLITPEEASMNITRSLLLQPLLQPSDWGHHSIYTPPDPSSITINDIYQHFYLIVDEEDDDPFASATTTTIDDWFVHVLGTTDNPLREPTGTPPVMSCWTTIDQLEQATKHAFSIIPNNNQYDIIPSLHNQWAIRAIQWLQQQQLLWNHSSVCETQGIRVVASSW